MLDPKVQLSITLTEPVLFLRSSDPSGRHQPDPNDPLTLARGILNLHVSKPIGISSIEVELTGVLTIIYPEGIGAGRVEVPEKQKIFSSTVTVFRADQAPRYGKRPASVGPGLGLSSANCSNDDNHEASMLASPPPSPRGRHPRRVAVSVPPDLGPTPPYTPLVQSPTSMQSRCCAHAENPAQTLEELRQALRDNLEVHRNELVPPSSRRHSIGVSPPNTTLHSNVCCASNDTLDDNHIDHSAHTGSPSGNTSFHNSIEDVSLSPNHPSHAHSPESTSYGSQPRTHENSRGTPAGRSRLRLSLSSVLDAVMEVTSRASSRSRAYIESEERERGRPRVRNVAERQSIPEIGERVADSGHLAENAPLPGVHMEHREYHLLGLGRVLGLERDHEKEKGGVSKSKEHEGWTEFKPGTYSYPISFLLPPNLPPTFSLPHGSLNYVIKAVVHRPGTFTSKLSCQAPLLVVAAPAIGVGEGGDPGPLLVQKQWEGKLAYSLGLSSRLFLVGSQRHLEAVASQGIRDSDSESLVQAEVEARSEPEYGTVMLDLTLLPLEKIKIWKLSVVVDQQIRHIDEHGKLYRDNDNIRVPLLELQDTCLAEEIDTVDEEEQTQKNKYKSKNGFTQIPLLPTPLSPHRSPLLRYISPSTDPSVLAGPGPYTLTTSIGLPSCDGPSLGLNFTVKQKSSSVKVEHALRLMLRVESIGGNDDHDKGGKKKLFDIAIQTPIAVLSCRCAPEFQTLPRYSQITQDSSNSDDRAACPCEPITEQGHHGHHHVSSVMTPSSTSSFESEDSCGGGPSHARHHHDQVSDIPGQHSGGHLERSRSSSRARVSRGDHSSPLQSPGAIPRQGQPGPGASRSSSTHAHDRDQTPSHGHGQQHHLHHYRRRSRSRHSHSHSHSRTQTPISTPHPSRPPSPVLARQYERLVSGLESNAGEAPPSYYESIASHNF